ncbi:MAG: ATP-binding protein [Candidatus Eremiobacteraeota bacterium]|nr:ATP-binding protein [Candidatus Eremiobacteraeota bacterium]
MNYSRYLSLFVILLSVCSLAVLTIMGLCFPAPPPFVLFLFTMVLYGLSTFKIKIPRVAIELSITWPVTFFGLWIWGPWIGTSLMAAILLYIATQVRSEWKLFKEYLKDYVLSTFYNLSYCCLISCLPGMVYYLIGGTPSFSRLDLSLVLALSVSASLCFLISFLATNTRIALFENLSPFKRHVDPLGELMELSLVSLSVVAVLIYSSMGPLSLLLLIVPALCGFYLLNFGIKAAAEKDDISVLFDFARSINSTLELEATLENIAEQARKAINAEGWALFLIGGSGEDMALLIAGGTLQSLPRGREVHDKGALLSSLGNIQNPVSSFKEGAHIRETFFPHQKGEISLALFREKGKLLGFLMLVKNQFERDHRSFLTILVTQAALAISNARLYLQALETNRELRAIQAQLVQSSKMSAVGSLAAGVAHRLSRPMKTILTSFNKVSSGVERTEKLERRLSISQRAIIRCIDIHEQLSHYTQSKESNDEEIHIWPFLEDTLELLVKLLEKDNIAVEFRKTEVRPIRGRADHLSQVITNLILNSKDALITARGTDRKIIITAFEAGKALHISVEDNGTGIREEVKERIFEPFFSTKDIGQGTGLGLSVSLEIVKRMGGAISVDSEPGKGAKFTISLPYPEATLDRAPGDVPDK